MAQAARERSSVERGDPLALYGRLAVFDEIETRDRVLRSYFPSHAAVASESVPVDHGHVAAGQLGEGAFAAGEDSAAVEHNPIIYPSDYVSTSDGRQWTMPLGLPSMRLPRGSRWTYAELDAEHERQRRLARWQRLP